MQKIIDETEERAFAFLKEFGFSNDEIAPVVAKGIFDLENTCDKLKILFNDFSEEKLDELDDLLHGLKGLLVQLGNTPLAEAIEKLRDYENIESLHDRMNEILFLEA